MNRQPFFYDVTLRDANQALKKPWNTQEKEVIFKKLLKLGVQAIEIGYPGASQMDFEAVEYLSSLSSQKTILSALARCNAHDIEKAAAAIKNASCPRIHTFIAMNETGLKYVLKKPIEDVTNLAVDMVKYAKSLLPDNGQVQFSVEHFGDCHENFEDVLKAIQKVALAGADVINLPNTVERFRPFDFVNMVKRVHEVLPENVMIAVHCHNDLGMASATTVESFFAGATQLECSLNGLGERAGNTNMYEVAVALHNSGVDVPLNFNKIYATALTVSELANVPIWEKAPIIGSEVLVHRSGIHQDGATKTKHLEKGAYIAFPPELVGRNDQEALGFTSQSGKTAIYEIINKTPYPISMQEAVRLVPFAKKLAEKEGELSTKQLLELYFSEICEIKGDFEFINFRKIDENKFNLEFSYKNKNYDLISKGEGPLEACLDMLKGAGFELNLLHYEQRAIDEEKGAKALAMTIINIEEDKDRTQTVRAIDSSTAKANVKAVFNALNLLSKGK